MLGGLNNTFACHSGIAHRPYGDICPVGKVRHRSPQNMNTHKMPPNDPPKNLDSYDPLAEATKDARTLLHFACSDGTDKEWNTESTLEVAIEAATTAQAGSTEKAKFWEEYHALGKALAPVTAQSIRATRGLQNKSWDSPRGWLAALAAFVFLLIVVAQSVWGFGNTYRQQLDKNVTAEKTAAENHAKVSALLAERTGNMALLDASKVDSAERQRRETQIQESKRAVTTADTELQAAQEARAISYLLYAGWYSRWTGWASSSKPDASDCLKCTMATDRAVAELRARGELFLDGIQRYGLAVLMGLLGAIVSTLRDLESQVKAATFRGRVAVPALVRIVLGMIAGMFGVLFIPESVSQSLVNGLPGMALSFVAGYSVELFFSLLDRIVTGIRSNLTPTKP